MKRCGMMLSNAEVQEEFGVPRCQINTPRLRTPGLYGLNERDGGMRVETMGRRMTGKDMCK